MSEQNTDREALGDIIDDWLTDPDHIDTGFLADAILNSEWMREHDTAVWNAGYAVATRHMREPSDWARIREGNTDGH